MVEVPATVALDLETDERFVPLRKHLGVRGFGINQLTLQPGQRMRIHRHDSQEEVYVVIEGRLVEGAAHTIAAGELMRVAPATRRQLANTHRERVTLVAVGSTSDGHESRDAEAFDAWTCASLMPVYPGAFSRDERKRASVLSRLRAFTPIEVETIDYARSGREERWIPGVNDRAREPNGTLGH